MARPRPGFTLAAALVLTFASGLALQFGAARTEAQAPPSPMPDPAVLGTFKWRSIGPDRGGRSIAVSGVKGRPKEGVLRRDRRRAVEDHRRRRDVGAGHRRPDHELVGRRGRRLGDRIPTSSSSAWASRASAATSCRATASTSRPTPARPGRTSASATSQTHLARSASIRPTPTSSSSRRSASTARRATSAASSRRTDGGKTWQRSAVPRRQDRRASTSRSIAAIPNVMYAALWEAYPRRVPDVERRPGQRPLQVHRRRRDVDGDHAQPRPARRASIGKIGVAVSGADSNRVYALVENENGGLFSSDDAGATWKLVNDGRNIRQRAFYYTHVFADPNNKDIVYVLNVGTFRSTDGGKTLTNFAGHGDSHDLWIDPDDSKHVVHAQRRRRRGHVQRAARRSGRGRRRTIRPAQFYHVITTKHVPYHVCGAQQDSSTVCVPSDTEPRRRRGGGGGGGGGRGAAPATLQRRRRRAGLHRARSEGPRRLLRRRQQRIVPDAAQSPHRRDRARSDPYPRMFSGEPSSALVERWQWTYPDHLLAGRSERALHRRRSTCGRRPTAARRGTRSAATSRATIRRRWATPAGRSRTT